jgi:hypothetical protein
VWIYSNSLMPDRAWLCGASALIYALFGLIAWRERKTSVFSLFGIRCLSLPPIPMLGIVLLADALFSKAFFSFIAWPVHTLAGLGGLITGMLLSFKPLRNPRYATAALFISAALAVLLGSGCRSPLVEINRNAPLISSGIQINDSANNNEIPLIK